MLGRCYEDQNCSIARALEIVGELKLALTGLRQWGDAHLGERPGSCAASPTGSPSS